MKKIFICLLVLAASNKAIFAQDEFDALRYSNTNTIGTARGMGVGGAVGSMGGDFTSLSVNPAGIGIYKSSEFMLTPNFSSSRNKGTYLGTVTDANSSKFNFSNAGLVLTKKFVSARGKNISPWRTFSFGLGMNRTATFKNEYVYKGYNDRSSIIESFADDFNSFGGINNNAISQVNNSAYAAYATYLVDRGIGSDSNKAVSYVPYNDGLNQTKRVVETGGMTEFVISAGGNYRDKLMIGATVGISNLKYSRVMNFNETDASGKLTNEFQYMNFTENLSTSGTGVNLKIGAIYKASPYFRFGFALHTPTHIELNDASYITMESHTDSLFLYSDPNANPISRYTQDSALVFNYSMNTPSKAIISAMVLFGKVGFLTADLEYMDYSTMKYKFVEFEQAANAMNQLIQNTYRDAVNFRIGAEARITNVALRAGYGYNGSPYKSTTSKGAKSTISGGIGFRDKSWFIDATYLHSIMKTTETPYILVRNDANVKPATIEGKRGNVLITLGFKF